MSVATHRYIARVTIEFTTPFHVGAGREGETADAAVVLDGNGLPTIPGSALAGVLRAAYEAGHGADAAKDLFGFQTGRGESRQTAQGHGSRLTVSWACIHDSANRPVEGLVDDKRRDDRVLRAALSPTIRDHVRISERGVADAQSEEAAECGVGGHGKFDESVVCAGQRFTFELELAGSAEDRTGWNRLLDLLRGGALRIGGKSRRGFGAFKALNCRQAVFDLRKKADFASYARHPVRLADSDKLIDLPAPTPPHGVLTATLRIEPEGYWMFGSGADTANDGADADMAPVRDRRIIWGGNRNSCGIVEENRIVIPGSAIKGAISHRVAYHANRLAGAYADVTEASKPAPQVGSNNEAVRALFGQVKKKGKNGGVRGAVLIDDVLLDNLPRSQLVHHVSLDRFTGGARAGLLFNERLLWKGNWSLRIVIVEPERIPEAARRALAATLADLAEGRLQLGGGSGRGLGFVTASEGVEWSDRGAWIGVSKGGTS